jgi:hypothetical protein
VVPNIWKTLKNIKVKCHWKLKIRVALPNRVWSVWAFTALFLVESQQWSTLLRHASGVIIRQLYNAEILVRGERHCHRITTHRRSTQPFPLDVRHVEYYQGGS